MRIYLLVTHSDWILIIGDFNIHLNKAFDPLSKAFLALLDTFGFTQFVHEPTHCSGNTLDLIVSHGIVVSALTVSSVTTMLSDHLDWQHKPVLVMLVLMYLPLATLVHQLKLYLLSDCLWSWLLSLHWLTLLKIVPVTYRQTFLVSLITLSTKTRLSKRSTPLFTE